ncbi:MAG: hypothetical protein CME62_07820 [Halobacteriovoraceae bacterium]|nr:hypothetical protein [Halobacteriovoraceae bacterium]|tara:strand:- start:8827 stop:9834 length:1008 start_codon:yes stop_codon:yes gene_type:complete
MSNLRYSGLFFYLVIGVSSIAAEPDFENPKIEDFFEDDVFKYKYLENLYFNLVDPVNESSMLKHIIKHKNKNGKSINKLVTYQGSMDSINGIKSDKSKSIPYILKKVHPYHYGKPSEKKTSIKVGLQYRLCSLIGSNVSYLEPGKPNFNAMILGCGSLSEYTSGGGGDHSFNLYELLDVKDGWGKFKLLDYDQIRTTTSKNIDTLWFKLNSIASPVTLETDKERVILPGVGTSGLVMQYIDKYYFKFRSKRMKAGKIEFYVPQICKYGSRPDFVDSIKAYLWKLDKKEYENQNSFSKLVELKLSEDVSKYTAINNLEILSGKKIRYWEDYCPDEH